MTIHPKPLQEVAIVVDPQRDNVAIAKVFIPAGTQLRWQNGDINLRDDIHAGHRFSLVAIHPGENARQYGQPFAQVRTEGQGLEAGDPVNAELIESIQIMRESAIKRTGAARTPITMPQCPTPRPTFLGFKRTDGLVGLRNWVAVVPTSMCSSHEAVQIAQRAETQGIYTRERYPNVDGVTALAHTGGCGCPDPHRNTQQPGAYESAMRILSQHMGHPNVGAVILVELGCEKTNLVAFDEYFGSSDLSSKLGKP
ncbi:MAG: UxaA family hydrolase, partial [Anaerolineae bacterium]|nr:UxaA family hydrolase [Anaerolineae bacterium]